jgi:hypothetical protein
MMEGNAWVASHDNVSSFDLYTPNPVSTNDIKTTDIGAKWRAINKHITINQIRTL